MADPATLSLDVVSSRTEESECPICYEDFTIRKLEEGTLGDDSTEDTISTGRNEHRLVGLGNCRHEFCTDCLDQHCTASIQDGNIPIQCPAHQCGQVLEEEQVHAILCQEEGEHDPVTCRSCDLWLKYRNLIRIKEDPSLKPCPECNTLVNCGSDNIDRPEMENNIVCCPKCGQEFCTVHGTIHFGMTCEEYEKSERGKQDALSHYTIQMVSKPCSHCSAPIEMIGGCDHVVCQICQGDFCYKCGTHIHLTGDAIRTCSNCHQSYLDHRQTWRLRVRACLQLPLWIPSIVVYVIAASVTTIVTGCCCFCFLCGSGVKEKRQSSVHDGQKQQGEKRFAPRRGVRLVAAFILLPVIDLMNQCGWGCLDGLLSDAPGEEDDDSSDHVVQQEQATVDTNRS